MTRVILPLLLLACTNKIVVSGDSGLPDEADADTDADSDADADADTDVEPVYENDFSVWDGWREFVFESDWYSCDDTIGEYGDEVTKNDRDWDDLYDLCPSCQHFYEVEPEDDSACDGYISLGRTWRGLEIDGDEAAVHLFRESDNALEEYGSDDHGEFDGEKVDFAYEFEYGWGVYVDVYGGVTFPLVLVE